MGLAAIVADAILATLVIGSALYVGRRPPGRHRGSASDSSYADLVRRLDETNAAVGELGRQANDDRRMVIRELGRLRMWERDTVDLAGTVVREFRVLNRRVDRLAVAVPKAIERSYWRGYHASTHDRQAELPTSTAAEVFRPHSE